MLSSVIEIRKDVKSDQSHCTQKRLRNYIKSKNSNCFFKPYWQPQGDAGKNGAAGRDGAKGEQVCGPLIIVASLSSGQNFCVLITQYMVS